MTDHIALQDPRSVELRRQAEIVARRNVTVLIQGPTGSGKEGIARFVHESSERASGRFVAVNCGAISPNLIESELFGCVRGAFTGATERDGYLAHAHGGTLFLDEIGDLPVAQQVKLLRVLDGHGYFPVGSTREATADIRFISATHRDLEAMCRQGTFREDLYSRIRQVELKVSPLEERREDVAALAHHFAARHRPGDGRFADEIVGAAERLTTVPGAWPRGIRELEAFVIRADCFGIAATEEGMTTEWRRAAGQPDGVAVQPPPGRDDSDRLTGLILDSMRTVRGRPRLLSSPAMARRLARRLLSGSPPGHDELQELLECDRRTLQNNLAPLVACGLVFDSDTEITLDWPPVAVGFFCREGEHWYPIAPGAIPLARDGDRIRIEVSTRLAIELRVFGVTHRRAGSEPRRLLIETRHVAARQMCPVEFELDHQPGFEQIMVHLSWPVSRGIRPVMPEIDTPFTPESHVLQRERSSLLDHLGPGWVEEYLVHHL